MKPNSCFGGRKPISLAALDACLSETKGTPVRRDRLARDDRVFRWICRRAIAEGTTAFNTTYAEAAAGSGYEVPTLNCRPNRVEARHRRVSTVYRALSSLRGAGLVRFEGVKGPNRGYRCLRIELLPAAYGPPPCGRSRRRPTRSPGNRVRFSSQSGTSPAVGPSDQTANCLAFARARGGAGPGTAAVRKSARRAILDALATPTDLADDRERRYERFDLTDTQLVELCEAFERSFGRPAKLSLRPGSANAGLLRRVLARFDRYTAGPEAGRREVEAIVKLAGQEARAGVGWAEKINSLAYFLPLLDEISKMRRRWWKRHRAEPWERSFPRQGLRGKAA